MMKFTTFAMSREDIHHLATVDSVEEVLLEPMLLAREGKLSLEETSQLATLALEHHLRPVLVWDMLLVERLRESICESLESLDLGLFSAIRVRDVGAAQFLFENYPKIPIQLSVEVGNHNLIGLKTWCQYFGDQLQRLILSIELPEEKLVAYAKSLPVPCEILGAGRILLFYSPRALLSPNFKAQSSPWIEVTSASEDSAARPFPTLETSHGTMMYLDKDQFILDRLSKLKEAGFATIRIDLKHLSAAGEACTGIGSLCDRINANDPTLRKSWPIKTLAPFFKTNKTTARFSKLKSPLHVLRDESVVAQLLFGQSGKFHVFYTLRAFEASTVNVVVTTTGDELEVGHLTFRGVDGETLEHVEASRIVITPWVRKASGGALLRCAVT